MAEVSSPKAATIVLIHGAFVDGSGWEGVYRILKKHGYNLAVVQNSTTSLAHDVGATKRALHEHDCPVILVGHSYGGAVITEAGTDPKSQGSFISQLSFRTRGNPCPRLSRVSQLAPVPPLLQPQDGYLSLDKTKFSASFADDVDRDKAAFIADSQAAWGVEATSAAVSESAWKTRSSWYLVAADDKMIPPSAQRLMAKRAGSTVVESPGSHAIYMSQPNAVAALIEEAAKGVNAASTRTCARREKMRGRPLAEACSSGRFEMRAQVEEHGGHGGQAHSKPGDVGICPSRRHLSASNSSA